MCETDVVLVQKANRQCEKDLRSRMANAVIRLCGVNKTTVPDSETDEVSEVIKSPQLIGKQSSSDDFQSLKSSQLIGVDVQVSPGRTGVGVADRAG